MLFRSIVKRLHSIENFGSMNVLCSDKTGTLTQGTMHLEQAVDVDGRPSERVLFHAALNATYETGFINPLDEALRTHRAWDFAGYRKLDEVPYDFVRKRLSILAAAPAGPLLITKGAVEQILGVCAYAEGEGGHRVPLEAMRDRIREQFQALTGQGFQIGRAHV